MLTPTTPAATEHLTTLLSTFGLTIAAQDIVPRLTQAGHLDVVTVMVDVFEAEREERHQRRIARLRRAARLPPGQTFDTLDAGRLPLPIVQRLQELATGAFLREAFPKDAAPRYLIRDRDLAFAGLEPTASGMGIQEVLTALRSPWQHAYAERLIESIRRECLDHVILVSEAGVRRVLMRYVKYYDERSRTHFSLDKDAPIPRPVAPPAHGPVVEIPEVGGLHHRYERRAA